MSVTNRLPSEAGASFVSVNKWSSFSDAILSTTHIQPRSRVRIGFLRSERHQRIPGGGGGGLGGGGGGGGGIFQLE